MKTIYILLTRSGTLLSNLVYAVTGANYTHASLAFDEDLFNVLGLALCGLHIRWKRRRHYFCSQFVSEVLEKSGSMQLPKHSTLMHPNDYTRLEQLRCVYEGPLAGLPQRRKMAFDESETVVSVYLGLALGLVRAGVSGVKNIF